MSAINDKLWGGRFERSTDEMINDFQASINFDRRLYREDIAGSIAHAKMLAKCEIISDADAEKIVAGLKKILARIEAGEFEFKAALEDIHMNVEAALTAEIGEAGGRLHTARSRNDQVALDMHLYVRRQACEIRRLIVELQTALVDAAEKNLGVITPGYTHLQRAQPTTVGKRATLWMQDLTMDLEEVGFALDSLKLLGNRGAYLYQRMSDKLVEHKQYIQQYGEDLPEVAGWKWQS